MGSIGNMGNMGMENLTNIVVSEGELGNITRVLGRLTLDTGATHVLLLDKSGQLIATQGPAGERDFRSILQQGVNESIYTSLVGEQWLLVIVFDKQTHIGLVKVLARKATEELERVLERVRVGGRQAKEQVVNVQFRSSVENTIDLLFQD